MGRLDEAIREGVETLGKVESEVERGLQDMVDHPFEIETHALETSATFTIPPMRDDWQLVVFGILSFFVLFLTIDFGSHRLFTLLSGRYRQHVTTTIDQVEWGTRVSSLLMATYVTVCCALGLSDPAVDAEHIFGVTPYMRYHLPMLLPGYFMADIVMVLLYRFPQWEPILAHHLIAGLGITYFSLFNWGCHWYACVIMFHETTALPNNIHWFLQMSRRDMGMVFTMVEASYLLFWVYFRLYFMTFFVYNFLEDSVAIYSHDSPLFWFFVANICFLSLFDLGWFVIGPFTDIVRSLLGLSTSKGYRPSLDDLIAIPHIIMTIPMFDPGRKPNK
eukprot:CAMPEP_0119120166 /NCGR_PEP_ID=MMETSP1310-20130426/1330_1 /TAXON_ID=464262 /ORGANISM="Genus nov. species nov., Strain RCC2339" /LENGTH=332 /DNA_ID=CAMNT_0007109633 /DNA_START=102 /DNA_END=1098 /DNA_ORIENTATION=-